MKIKTDLLTLGQAVLEALIGSSLSICSPESAVFERKSKKYRWVYIYILKFNQSFKIARSQEHKKERVGGHYSPLTTTRSSSTCSLPNYWSSKRKTFFATLSLQKMTILFFFSWNFLSNDCNRQTSFLKVIFRYI